jgi:ATP-dependent DNA helicase PIF1
LSSLQIPIDLTETTICNFTPRSDTKRLIDHAELIVFDEITMGHRHAFETVARTIQQFKMPLVRRDQQDSHFFGNSTVLFAGDWMQILPVVVRGNEGSIFSACLMQSLLWQHVTKVSLSVNVRALNAGGNFQHHADFLMLLGRGQLRVADLTEWKIRIPDRYQIRQGNNENGAYSRQVDDLIDFVYGGYNQEMEASHSFTAWLAGRAIICPTNREVRNLNRQVLFRYHDRGVKVAHAYNAAETRQGHLFPVDFLKMLNPSGFPEDTISLAPGCPVILTRNVDPAGGHVNGSKYTVVAITRNRLVLKNPSGKVIHLPRFTFKTDSKYQVPFTRRQFPVQLAYSITAHKSQGQTLQRAGIYLPTDCFAHGQLYVCLSRVGNPDNVKVMIKQPTPMGVHGQWTNNVVYQSVIRNA